VKKAVIKRRVVGMQLVKTKIEQNRTNQFNAERDDDDGFYQRAEVGHRLLAESFLQNILTAKRNAAADDDDEESRERDDAQTAGLNRKQQHDLPEARELRADVEDGQTGDTASRSDGEERINETHRRRGTGLRQHEAGGAGGDQQNETDHEHARGIADDMQAKPFQGLIAPVNERGEKQGEFLITWLNKNFSESFKLSLGNG